MHALAYAFLLIGFTKFCELSRDFRPKVPGILELLHAHEVLEKSKKLKELEGTKELEEPKVAPYIFRASDIVVATVVYPQPSLFELNNREPRFSAKTFDPKPPSGPSPCRFLNSETLHREKIQCMAVSKDPAVPAMEIPRKKTPLTFPKSKPLALNLSKGAKVPEDSRESFPALSPSELTSIIVKERIDVDARRILPFPLSKLWYKRRAAKAELRYTIRKFDKTHKPGITSLIAGHQRYKEVPWGLFTLREYYGIKIAENSFQMDTDLREYGKRKEKNDLDARVTGKFKGQHLELNVRNVYLYRTYLYDQKSITELESGKEIVIQNDNVLFMVPDGVTGNMIKECLGSSKFHDEAVDCLTSKHYELYNTNADIIIAKIGHL